MNTPRTLLIVDDSIEDRIMLSAIFKNRFTVLEAADGREALGVLSESKDAVSVILLDLYMPNMDGYELLERINVTKGLKEIPVLVITSESEFENEIRVMELGAADYIVKPFTPSIVLGRVCNAAAEFELRKSKALITDEGEDGETLEELRYLAEHDSLTGLYNFRTFCLKASELIKSGDKRYAVYRVDINNFRVVNDFFGFDTGNRVLGRIGSVCALFAESGYIAARIASDDFVFCREYVNEEQTQSIVNLFFEKINSFGLDYKLMPNFGIYIADNTDEPVNLMCDRAYLALRDIKGSCVKLYSFYNERHRASVVLEQEIVNSMYTALENECFEVYFQPQYDYVNGSIIGAEALARWNDTKLKNLSPGVFIPVFEKNGFITQLDEYVWDKACAWLGSWLSDPSNKPMSISVNLSRVDIFDPMLYTKLVNLVEKYNVPPRSFRLEITESAYVENPRQLVEVVGKLQSYGFLIEMDDFGSGYSSLNTLKDVPVDVLKLDTRFLSGSNAEKGLMILNSVVRMASWLSLSVIAEGVETAEQAEFLKSIGCNRMQGYLFSRPVPISAFEVILRSNDIEPYDTSSRKLLSAMSSLKLWNNDAFASVVFSDMLGPAGVFELTNGRLYGLRVNERFYKELCIARDTENGVMLELSEVMRGQDYKDMCSSLKALKPGCSDITSVYTFYREASNDYDTAVQLSFHLLTPDENGLLLFVTAKNMTS